MRNVTFVRIGVNKNLCSRLRLDDKNFGRGHDYISVMTDLKGSRVLEVVPGRDQVAGETLLQSLPEGQRENRYVQRIQRQLERTQLLVLDELGYPANTMCSRIDKSSLQLGTL